MSTWLIAGLGNPGGEYAETYHNVGFRVVARIAAASHTKIRERCGSALIAGPLTVGGQDAVLVLPQAYMNRSGAALPPLFERFETGIGHLVVVYDDIALPVGRMRVRQKGSAGGHNGIKSIVSSCGSDEFLRVRVGIGPEPNAERPSGDMRDFVLSEVARSDRECLDRVESEAVRAIETILAEGVGRAMAVFNGIDLRDRAKED